jgi:Tfp pilus assembly protein PilF
MTRTALCLALAALLAACGGKEERLKSHLEKGRALFAESELDKAGVEVRNVLQIDPRSADAYQLSAQIWERKADFRRAYGAYAKALELAPGNLEAKAKIARYHLFGNDAARAEEIAREILAAAPADAGGLTLMAAVAARKGDTQAAVRQARAVLEAHPGHVDASALLASLLAQTSDPAEAAKVLAAGVEKSPADVGLRLALASVRAQLKDTKSAEAELRRVVQIEPGRYEHRLALARLLARNGAPERAEQVLREAAEAGRDEERRALALVEHVGATRGFEAAERELRRLIEARPRAYDLRFGLASLLLNARRGDDAAKVYEEIARLDRSGAKGLQARGALVRLHAAEGRDAEAAKLVAAILEENPRDNTALLYRAQQRLQAGDATAAIADLRAVLRDQPDSTELNALLARAHLANKEPELAEEALARAVDAHPRQNALRHLYASFLVNQGRHASALKTIDELLRERPKDLQALQARAEVQAAAKDLAGAEQTLKRMLTADPESPLGHYRLAQFYVAQRKSAAARAQLEAALAKAPRNVEVLGALVKLMLAGKKTGEAETQLRKAAAAHADDALIQVMLGEFLSVQRRYGEAEPAFRRALEIAPRLEAARVNLARLKLAQQDPAGAGALVQEGLALAPRSTRLAALRAEIHQVRGENLQAIAQYEAILAYAPGNDLAANNLAALIADHAAEPKALARALEVTQRFERSPNPLYLDTLGWVHYRRGEHARAVEVLGRAAQKASIPVVHYHLGMALHKAGKVEEARAQLRKALEAKAPFRGRDEARALLASG